MQQGKPIPAVSSLLCMDCRGISVEKALRYEIQTVKILSGRERDLEMDPMYFSQLNSVETVVFAAACNQLGVPVFYPPEPQMKALRTQGLTKPHVFDHFGVFTASFKIENPSELQRLLVAG